MTDRSGEIPQIVIFRQNQFRPSEVFIRQQAESLTRYRPLYVGRASFGPTPPGREALFLNGGGSRVTPRALWQMLTRDPGPYLRLLGARRPALIHAHFGVDGVQILPLARRLGVPLVTTFHGFDATLKTQAFLRSPAWFNYPLFRASLARHGAFFLCASEFIRSKVLAMGFPPERTRTHYLGVDCGAIVPRESGEETQTVLHVARLVEIKGTEILIRAFAIAARSRPGWRLEIIGDGPLRGRLEALVRDCGVKEAVDFLGVRPHEEVMMRMRRSAMVVLPSIEPKDGRREGLGMVLLEAAAIGLPVIGSRSGGIAETMCEGESGLLVPPGDPQALATTLATLMDDPTRRLAMGASGREFVTRNFDRGRQTKRLEALYDALLQKSSPLDQSLNLF